MGACCVRSWISYGLKHGIPWNYVLFLFVYNIFCLPINEKHKHYIVWDQFVSAHGSYTSLNGEYLGIIFCFYLFIIILCLPVHEKHKHYLVWEHVASAHGSATALNRKKFFLPRENLFKSVLGAVWNIVLWESLFKAM